MKTCSRSVSVSISAAQMRSSTCAEGAPPRPCSSQVYQVELMWASWATSSRRSPVRAPAARKAEACRVQTRAAAAQKVTEGLSVVH